MPGPNSPYTQLDANQVLKQSFDESQDRLRVDAAITVDNVTLDVQLDQANDSVSIGDGTTLYTGTTVGSDHGLDVNIIGGTVTANIQTAGQIFNNYNEILSVANGVTTNIVSYTSGAGTTNYLQKVSFSGTNIAAYELLVNGVVIVKKYTYFSGPLNDEMVFNDSLKGLLIPTGQIVTVRVTHNRPDVGNFNARIQTIRF